MTRATGLDLGFDLELGLEVGHQRDLAQARQEDVADLPQGGQAGARPPGHRGQARHHGRVLVKSGK